MRIVGISSSPRHANTELLVHTALQAAEEAPTQVETELLSFVGKRIEPCTDCQVCATKRRRCIKRDDWQELIDRLIDPAPDGVIVGSPVYFFNTNAQLRAFFERCTSLLKGLWIDDYPYAPPDFSRTAAAAIAVGYHRHGGIEHALSNILQWCLTIGMVCTGSDYIGGGAWQQHVNTLDCIKDDELGLLNARVTGRNVAYLAYLLSEGATANHEMSESMLAYRQQEQAMG